MDERCRGNPLVGMPWQLPVLENGRGHEEFFGVWSRSLRGGGHPGGSGQGLMGPWSSPHVDIGSRIADRYVSYSIVGGQIVGRCPRILRCAVCATCIIRALCTWTTPHGHVRLSCLFSTSS